MPAGRISPSPKSRTLHSRRHADTSANIVACSKRLIRLRQSILKAVFAKPVPSTLEWSRIESLFVAAGARAIEGNGSRVRFELNGVVGTFHRPHHDKEAKPYQVRDARAFLEQPGVTP